LIATAERMAAAAEAMQSAVARIEAQNAELAQRVERIVAEVEDSPRRHGDTEEKAGRKTIDPVVSMLLAKSGVDVDQKLEAAALDASLATLPVEQRIAVKAQLARTGLIA
jgi:molecular chaperone GrpE (heat shock protein)